MASKTRILIADRDLNSLSRIYLALLHRNFKVEATNNTEEIDARIKRLKPSLVILGAEEFEFYKSNLKTPAIVLGKMDGINKPEEIVFLEKNFSIETLMKKIGEMVI